MDIVDELGKIVIAKDGKEVECDILFTFDNEELQRTYVGYTDHSIDQNNREVIYIAYYNMNAEKKELKEIQTQEELDMVHDVLEEIAKQA
mgnify:CR=1 FL=1